MAIIELIYSLGGLGLTENRTIRGRRFKDNAMVCYDSDLRNLPGYTICPLYVTTSIREVEMKRAMTDLGSFLNIISPSVLMVVAITQEKITRQPIEVFGFRGKCEYTLFFVNLDPTVGPMRTSHRSHVTDLQPHTTCCLGSPWSTIIRSFLLHIINV